MRGRGQVAWGGTREAVAGLGEKEFAGGLFEGALLEG